MRATPGVEGDGVAVVAGVSVGSAVVARGNGAGVVPDNNLVDIFGGEARGDEVRAQVDNRERVNDEQHERLDVRLVERLVNLERVGVLNIRQTRDDVLGNVQALENALKNAVGALCERGVEGALKLELLDAVTKFGRTANDERDDSGSRLLVADRRRHRVDQLLFEVVLGLCGNECGVEVGVIVVDVNVALCSNGKAIWKVKRSCVEARACGGAERAIQQQQFGAQIQQTAQ